MSERHVGGVVAVSAGTYHTCALTSAGAVECWGDNEAGQLGDGTTTDRNVPVPVYRLTSGIVAIQAGGFHTCALTDGGGVECWGDNRYGQLGDGTEFDRKRPVPVFGLTSGVVAVAAGAFHTCALTTDGGVECWGLNDVGQLGDGTTIERVRPIAVHGLTSGVVAIGAGDYDTCALTSAGAVECWGGNEAGQLGDGTTDDRFTPWVVSGLARGVVAIAVGDHSCAVTRAGRVKCWGYNSSGELGDGTKTDRSTPVTVSRLAGAVAVAVGFSHTCARTNGGAVKCWGENYAGQIGDGNTRDRHIPVAVSGLSKGVAGIAAAGEHSCALTRAGRVKCWGYNGYGQLGDGTTTSRLTPVGPGPRCIIPNVIGMRLGSAKAAIRTAQCGVGRIRYLASSPAKRNRVLREHPRPHAKLGHGAPIQLTVGRG